MTVAQVRTVRAGTRLTTVRIEISVALEPPLVGVVMRIDGGAP